jgi:hypothetical protein
MENSNEYKDAMDSVRESILKGEVYAHVESVSNSGMSRRILFYRIESDTYNDEAKNINYHIENITCEVAWLTEWIKQGEVKQGGKWISEAGFRVGGCGMDMIFHTLYSALGAEEAKKWNQKYNTL